MITEILKANKILYIPSGNQISIQCPFCKKTDINGDPLASFNIDQTTGQGNCGECHKIKRLDEWLEALEITDEEIVNKPHKAHHSKKQKGGSEVEPQSTPEPARRVIKVDKPEHEVSFDEWKSTIKANFPEFVFSAEVAASVIAQILITEISNPFALVLVGVPASGKTITINFFDGIEGISYATDKFTPASFVSNATNVRKEDLSKIDLLPRIRYKALLIRDFATIFSKNEDNLNEALGLLTRVLDGEGLSTDSGVHGQRGYSGDYVFMMLGASTPFQSRVWKVMGSIGSRLFFLNMGSEEKSEAELVRQITTLSPKEKEKVCRKATKNFIQTLWSKNSDGVKWDKEKENVDYMLIIARCAKLLAKLRGTVYVWEKKAEKDDGFVHQSAVMEYQPPVIEQPDRINQLLYNLCRGHAVLYGRRQISSDDLRLAIELATDSAPIGRVKLIRGLLAKNGVMKTHEVEAYSNFSKTTALKEMETLRILGIATITAESGGHVGEPENEIRLHKDFEWFLSEDCKAIRGLISESPTAIEDTPW
jgi:phage FluMu protein Com